MAEGCRVEGGGFGVDLFRRSTILAATWRWKVRGSAFRVQGQELRHHGSGFRSDSEFRVSGFRCRVHLRVAVPSAVHFTRPSAGKGLLLEPELLARDRVLREVVGAPLLPRERNRDSLLFTQGTKSALPEIKSTGSEMPFSCGPPGTKSGARTSCDYFG